MKNVFKLVLQDILEDTVHKVILPIIHQFPRSLTCVKSVRILRFSRPYFTAFALNTERY